MSRSFLIVVLFILMISFILPDQVLAQCPCHDVGQDGGGDTEKEDLDADDDEDDKKDKWVVDESHGPETTLQFETQEGTWMSVDVSPDGRQLVFDLLGDLYLMSIDGGKAMPLTKGRAYDFQPRWSPDGSRILFTSDRGGTDNVWVINADGSHAEALTEQKDKVTNSGDWSPDGHHIIVRRRLTDRSSIGTVELWLVDTRGGTGIQVTEKSTFGDANSPVFGHDGNFIYYAGRKDRFSYGRNPNEGFWVLTRQDLKSGEVRALSNAVGGSGRPRMSPDGKRIAIVRRIREKSCIYIYDLETGKERLVTDTLDPDMQTNFAWTGIYPGYDWTPDGKDLVLSAQGKLWRVNVATGTRVNIPFTVNVERQVAEHLWFQQDIDSETVPLKILRWPLFNNDGSRVFFSAIGHLYGMDVADGKPQRLTESDHLEFSPALSPDGKRLVYITWTDAEGSQVYSCRQDGSAVRQLTTQAGNYHRPAYSPDGRLLVFLRGSGAFQRGGNPSREPWWEIVTMPVGGGDLQVVAKVSKPCAPTFTADGQRIFFLSAGKEHETVLSSLNLQGNEKRHHVKSKFLVDISVSPDGEWIAYKKDHQVWLSAMPKASHKVVVLGKQLPNMKLTTDSADWPGWSPDGRHVSYSLGSTFYRLELAQVVEKLHKKKIKDGKKKDWKPSPEIVEVDLQVVRNRPSGLVAYNHARIISMKGDEIIEDGLIVVDGNRIVAVGSSADVIIPAGSKVIDLKGKTVIPGFIDVHAHMHWGFRDIVPEQDSNYFANLAYGVTTIHDPSAFSMTAFGQAERVATGATIGPRVFSTGAILYGADGQWKASIDSVKDALMHVRRMKAYGAISVKSYMQPRREQRQMVLQAAREEGIFVFPEGGGNLEMNLSMVIDGHSGIEHTLPVAPLYNDIITLLSHSQVGITPTMLVSYGGLAGEKWFYQHFDVWKNEKLLRFHPQSNIDRRSRRRDMNPEEDYHHKTIAKSLKRLVEAGGSVQLGSHGQLQGLGAHWDLWAMSHGGMKPHDVLRCGTVFPAKYIGMDKDLGTIEPGKLADFQVLERNPLDDIQNTDSLVYVIVNGRLFDANTMAQLWPEEAPCPTFYWQK